MNRTASLVTLALLCLVGALVFEVAVNLVVSVAFHALGGGMPSDTTGIWLTAASGVVGALVAWKLVGKRIRPTADAWK